MNATRGGVSRTDTDIVDEINMIYVAVTRARTLLRVGPTLKNFLRTFDMFTAGTIVCGRETNRRQRLMQVGSWFCVGLCNRTSACACGTRDTLL